jgi:hypothetical protein
MEEIVTVYDTTVEVCLDSAFGDNQDKNDELIRQLRSLRRKHDPMPQDLARSIYHTQEQDLLDLFWQRACLLDKASGGRGYVGSYQNCTFNLLYGVFGIDILAFLFGQPWVPKVIIRPFDPESFLDRLSVLERAAEELEDGTMTPVPVPGAATYVQKGMGPELESFKEEQHRFLLQASLQEIRDFGELGRSLRDAKQDLSVDIHIWTNQGQHEDDDEIMKFAANRN